MSPWSRSEGAHGDELDFSLDAGTAFDVAEIDTFVLEGANAARDPADEFMVPSGPAVSRPGDLWQVGQRRILCADALEGASYERLLEGRVAGARADSG